MPEQHIENNISKVLVLCSSGLDSAYNLLEAVKKFKTVEVIFFDYGQKAQAQEYIHVKKICAGLKVGFTKVDLQWYRDVSISSSLLSNKKEVTKYNGLNSIDNSVKPLEWVPNRNGVMINVAAAYAEAKGFEGIIIGINKEEAGRYPDNTVQFVDRCNALLEYSTLTKPFVFSFTSEMEKAEILENFTSRARDFDMSPQIIWSCYESYEKMCGVCESCTRLKEVVKRSGRIDEWRDSFLR
jgi:7-cyano-7-deazaguanine synthase